MILIWRGAGILVVFTFAAPLLLAAFGAEVLGGKGYIDQHVWPLFVATAVSVAATWYVGKWLANKPGRLVRDVNTGEQIELKSRHDLFYIPFGYWAIIGGVFSLQLLIPLALRDHISRANASSAPIVAASDWHSLHEQGNAARKAGNYLRAEPLLQQALQMAEQSLGADSVALAPVLDTLGEVQRHREEWPAAEATFQRELTLQEHAHGRQSAQVALTLDALAEVYLDKSDEDRAQPLLLEAQSILEALPNASQSNLGLVLHDLGALRYMQDRYDDARALWQRALTIREHDDPSGSPTATTRYNLAMLAEVQGHHDEAKTLYEASLAASEKSHGPTHPETGDALLRLAEWYVKNDPEHAATAVPLLQRVISIYRGAYGYADGHMLKPIEKLAALHNQLGHSNSAETTYLQLIDVADKLDSGEARRAASNAHLQLAEIYDAHGDKDSAAEQRSIHDNAARIARDTNAVRNTFAQFKNEISKGHGKETAALVTSSTVAYYENLRQLALYGTHSALSELSSIDLLNVLMLRHQIPANQLRQFASGQTLFADLIDRGWIGSGQVETMSIVAIHINGDDAIVDLKTADDGTLDYRFHREDKTWKLDFARIIQASSAQWDAKAKSAGANIEDYLTQLLSKGNYGVVDAAIWNPPFTKEAKR